MSIANRFAQNGGDGAHEVQGVRSSQKAFGLDDRLKTDFAVDTVPDVPWDAAAADAPWPVPDAFWRGFDKGAKDRSTSLEGSVLCGIDPPFADGVGSVASSAACASRSAAASQRGFSAFSTDSHPENTAAIRTAAPNGPGSAAKVAVEQIAEVVDVGGPQPDMGEPSARQGKVGDVDGGVFEAKIAWQMSRDLGQDDSGSSEVGTPDGDTSEDGEGPSSRTAEETEEATTGQTDGVFVHLEGTGAEETSGPTTAAGKSCGCGCACDCAEAGDEEDPGGLEPDPASQPGFDPEAQSGESASGSENDPPWFTTDQIADQLTLGYWQSVGGGGARSFNVGPGDTLNVDITSLSSTGQALARQALDAWTAVTGIVFAEIDAMPEPTGSVVEAGDAPSSTITPYAISVGEAFLGTNASGADRDAVAVSLVAGRSYTITLSGDDRSGNPNADPYLRLLNAAGSTVAQNDDAIGRDSQLTYVAPTTGTFFIQAGSYADGYSGDYEIRFAESGSAPLHISFGDQDSGAYASSTVLGSEIISSSINVNANWTGGENRIDGYHYQTYLHEIGHALGLGHAGNYNGSAAFGSDNHYQNDSWSTSLMSYFHQTENSFTSSSFAYAITPMMGDVLAIQNLYGLPDHATGDTVYGQGGNSGTYLDDALAYARDVAFTVFDTDGIDHFAFSAVVADQRLDLRDETFSDLAGLIDNVAIARDTIIEWGSTGAGDDTLTGNETDNVLWAGAGDDSADGGGGHDVLLGGAGVDTLAGGDGFDLLVGGEGASLLEGSAGGDLLIGGEVTLDLLTSFFPTWTPPADAQARIDADEVHVLWDDILTDVFGLS